MSNNAPVKGNPAPPPHMAGVRLTILGTLTTAILFDIILTIQMVDGILKANGRVQILTDYQNSLG